MSVDFRRLKNPVYYTHGKGVTFMPFPRALALSEIQPAESWNWIRIAGSIPYNYNRYATNASLHGQDPTQGQFFSVPDWFIGGF